MDKKHLRHIYFDDDQPSVDAAKLRLQELRAANPDTQRTLINQYQAPHGEKKNIAERVLTDASPDPAMLETLARNMAINQRLARDYQLPFERLLHEEHQRRKHQLSFTDDYMAAAGYPGFNAQELFVKMGVGNGRVILSKPVIMPFHAPDDIWFDHRTSNPDVRLITFGIPSKIEGLSSRLAIYGLPVKNARDSEQLCLIPLILLDPKVMGAIQSLSQSDNQAVKAAAGQVLPGLQSLIPYGMHDYVHQMILANTDPQTIKLRTAGEDAPLNQFRMEERKQMFRNNHKFRPEYEGEINTTNVYELHADLLNRDVWRESFTKEPKIKTHVVRMATQFLSDVETLRGELAKNDPAFANSFATLMVALSMNRFLRVVNVNDDELAKPMKLRNGGEISFIGACNALQMEPMTIDKKRALRWQKSVQVDAIVQDCVTPEAPKLLQVFAQDPTLFPNLGKLADARQLTGDLSFSGFENVIARGFSNTGMVLNAAALMYNFPERGSELFQTAKLLNDNYRVMCTDMDGHEPIPAAFNASMTHYNTIAKSLSVGSQERLA